MSEPPARTYTYGDSAVAGDRLAILATIFGPTSATFLRRDAPRGPAVALDLGCGPGYTTALLHDVVHPVETVGLERSDVFVLRARIEHGTVPGTPLGPGERSGPTFLPHDVTLVPFPTGPADLVFARYLLAHLPDPFAVRERWLTQVRPGGRLLLEEIDRIDTSIGIFGRYLEVVSEMSEGHGTDLYVGRRLAASPPETAGVQLVGDGIAEISPDPRLVARIFSMNLSVWRDDPWVRANVAGTTVTALADDLAALAQADPPEADQHGAITWHHRQLAYAVVG